MSVIDNYFPFTSGPGATATMTRWRLMARNFVPGGSGVIFGYLNGCFPTMGGSQATVGTGAVWIDGFYGENTSPKTLSAIGNGMLVARMDPNTQQISFVFVAGQTTPTQDPLGIYEIPIAQIVGTSLTDIRKFTYVSGAQLPGTVVQEQANYQPGPTTGRSYNVVGWQNFYNPFTFTKQNAGSRLRFEVSLSGYMGGSPAITGPPTGGGQISTGVVVNNAPVIQLINNYINSAAVHYTLAGMPAGNDLSGVPAGQCTIQPQIRLYGAGQVFYVDSNDLFSMTVKEVW